MTTGGFSVLKPGTLATLQDAGRVGFQRWGVSPCGAVDYLSFYWGNRLHNNIPNAAQIEIAYGDFSFSSNCSASIAVTGAVNTLHINGEVKPMWMSHGINPGDVVTLGRPQNGLWNYLSVRGGFQVMPVLASVATSPREGLGGLEGEGTTLAKGDIVPVYASQYKRHVWLGKTHQPQFTGNQYRVTIAATADFLEFNKEFKRLFFDSSFVISQQSNKMGVRLHLEGEGVAERLPEKLFQRDSEATSWGAIQVPPSGDPIILMSDRQTVGGYPKFGCVTLPDCWNLAQYRPGTRIRFSLVRVSTAQARFRHFQQQLQRTRLSSD